MEDALQRQEAFRNLPEHLRTIKTTVQRLDAQAEIYLFGSVAEEKHSYSSDIDVLVITNLKPATVHAQLWKAKIKEPFEIHVHTRKEAEFFEGRARLTKV